MKKDGPATTLGLLLLVAWAQTRRTSLWNGRPRIVPSLWGDHSTAARTVALSPSNSYGPG